MRELNVEELKKRANEEYWREKHALELAFEELRTRHRARLEAIEWLASPNGSNGPNDSSTAYLENILDALDDQFTRMDVEAALGDEAPSRHALVRDLEKLVSSRMLRIAVQGRGRRATEYKKLEAR